MSKHRKGLLWDLHWDPSPPSQRTERAQHPRGPRGEENAHRPLSSGESGGSQQIRPPKARVLGTPQLVRCSSPACVHSLLERLALKIRSSGMQDAALARHLLSFSVKKCTDHVLHYSVLYPQGELPCSSPGSSVAGTGLGWVWLSGRLPFTLRCLCVTSGRALPTPC